MFETRVDRNVRQYIREFSPIFFLHPDEPFRPISVEEYKDKCIITPTYMKCSLSKRGWDRQHYAYGPLNNAPIYAFAKIDRDDKDDKEIVRIAYCHCWGYNTGKKVGCMVIGDHQCDFEHVQVIVDLYGGFIKRIYFSAHGSADGFWKEAKDITYTGSHPHVFVALHSHGCYPRAGNWYRIAFLGNDYTAIGGPTWQPQVIRVYGRDDPRAPEWVKYKGKWGVSPNGSTHVSTPRESKLLAPQKSSSWFHRLFCCCIPA